MVLRNIAVECLFGYWIQQLDVCLVLTVWCELVLSNTISRVAENDSSVYAMSSLALLITLKTRN